MTTSAPRAIAARTSSLGVGRSGSLVGSLVGGTMLADGSTLGTVYGIVAIPVLIASASVFRLSRAGRRR